MASARTPFIPGSIDDVKFQLSERFGTSVDDDKAENPIINEFLDDMADLNFYDYMALMKADPIQSMTSWRSYAKILMLPVLQFLCPIILVWHQLPKGVHFGKKLTENGICPDNDGLWFRALGLVMITYAVWQIVDMAVEGPTITLSQLAARHYSMTSLLPNITFTFGFWVQWWCGIMLEFALYVLLCGSDNPLDIVMNCVALNFLLQVDDEWVTDRNKEKGKKAAEYVFKDMRDSVDKYEDEIRKGLKSRSRFLRRHAEQIIVGSMKMATYVTSFVGHSLAIFFFCCNGNW